MSREVFLRWHLGLGDALICNAIVRQLAKGHRSVVLPVKAHNAPSVAFMFRDLRHVQTLIVDGDDETDDAVKFCEKHGKSVVKLGFYGSQPFDKTQWDREFYRQAGISFQTRWNGFRVERQPSREIAPPRGRYIFVHDDAERGAKIDEARLPKGVECVRADAKRTPVFFDWWHVMERAEEMHLMESCFAIFADSMPTRSGRVIVHAYARESIAPTYQNKFEILK